MPEDSGLPVNDYCRLARSLLMLANHHAANVHCQFARCMLEYLRSYQRQYLAIL
jgi:hypothetical protein